MLKEMERMNEQDRIAVSGLTSFMRVIPAVLLGSRQLQVASKYQRACWDFTGAVSSSAWRFCCDWHFDCSNGSVSHGPPLIFVQNNGEDDNTTIVDLHKRGFPIVTVERYGEELKDVPRILFANREAEEQELQTAGKKLQTLLKHIGRSCQLCYKVFQDLGVFL